MCPMVPTFTCGLLRSNFSLAMSSRPLSTLRVRSCACALPTVAAIDRSADSLSLGAWTAVSTGVASGAGADDQNRTGDLVLTKDALCQLSYIGLRAFRLASSAISRPFASLTSVAATSLVRSDWLAILARVDPEPMALRTEPLTAIAPCALAMRAKAWSGRRGSNPRPTAWKAVTLPLSYSRLRARLPFCSTLRRGKPARASRAPVSRAGLPTATLDPWLAQAEPAFATARVGLPTEARVQRAKVGGEGRTRTFEATRATDLQSAAFDRSATSPVVCVDLESRVLSTSLTLSRTRMFPRLASGGAGGGI